jgi:hypothetical protein
MGLYVSPINKGAIMRRIIISAVVAAGIVLLLVLLFSYAGIEDVINLLKRASIFYLAIFILLSVFTHMLFSWRWQLILRHQGYKIPFINVFVYKLMGFAVSYFTPAIRVGGEPVRAYMLKRHGIRMSKGLSSILLDKTLEFTIEFVAGMVLVFLFALFLPLPSSMRTVIILGMPLGIVAIGAFYYGLFNKLRPFSALFRFAASIFRTKQLRWAKKKSVKIERYFIAFLKFKRKEAAKIIFINLFIWTLRFVEYKIALLSVGFNASVPQLFAAIVVFGLVSIIPIPAALGVLEAGQLSLFATFDSGSTGLVLALILRAKDMIWALLGLTMLSYEGVNLLEVFSRKISNNKK